MKKFLLLLSVALCVSVYAALEIKANTKAETVEAINNASEKYEFVANVDCLVVNIKSGTAGSRRLALYKGINTCGSYYLYFDQRYYPAYRNNLSSYKNVDVSDYNNYAQFFDCRYFFFY